MTTQEPRPKSKRAGEPLKVEPAPVEDGAEEDELAAEDGAVLDADAPEEEALAEEEPEADVRGNVLI